MGYQITIGAVMNILRSIFIGIVAISVTSCATAISTQEKGKEVAGYTIKNKKELLQQKVLHKNPKTVIATP
ncbi:MAG: hypothetical protein CL596_01540 [Alteromonas sp.]|nr:hypothetical protein [Alteromonas sp.]MAY22834.1 hypothetical protein [Flavobacteriaceae bacterium]